MIATVQGVKARFCNEGCKESFEEDRMAGLIYGSWEAPDGKGVIGWEEGSMAYEVCAYCRRDLSKEPNKDKPIKPPRKKRVTRKPCPSCQIMYINGVRCHEIGCPEGP